LAGGQQPQGIEEFRKALLKAVDDGLLVIGESARDALLYHMERSFGIRHQEIPERLEGFHEALGDLLGAGARVVETLIAKNLYDALGLNFEGHENWTIIDYVSYAANAKRGR
jgi:hypothetical protein